MDPVTTIAAGTELWKVGGIAAVLLAVIVIGGYLMFRFLIGQIRDLGARLNEVQDRQVQELSAVVAENTKSNLAVVSACDRQGVMHAQVLDALRSRPCLIETGEHRAVRPPIPHTPAGGYRVPQGA